MRRRPHFYLLYPAEPGRRAVHLRPHSIPKAGQVGSQEWLQPYMALSKLNKVFVEFGQGIEGQL